MKTCFIKVSLLSQGRAENLIRGHAKKQLKLTAYYLTNACLLKSGHFKKTVARISFLSKLWYFLF